MLSEQTSSAGRWRVGPRTHGIIFEYLKAEIASKNRGIETYVSFLDVDTGL